jgi:hypothetical protein
MALAACAVVIGGSVGSASAAEKFDSKVTIKRVESESVAFAGRVSSKRERCERRTVRLFVEPPQMRRGGSEPLLVDSDETNEQGRWKIELGGLVPAGDYFAKIRRERLGGAVCRGDESPRISLIE